jgi:acetyltransferase-like isoleucine patch superfamily enzyme
MDAMKHPLPKWKRGLLRLDRWWQRLRTEALLRQFESCGRRVSIQWPVVVNGADHVSVGDDVSINAFVHIWGQGGVRIGDSTLIASHAAITSLTHAKGGPTYGATLEGKPVVIGRNVWIGAHAVVLPGVTIGDNAIVGAGAVVLRDVAPGDIVAGVPAESIRPPAA